VFLPACVNQEQNAANREGEQSSSAAEPAPAAPYSEPDELTVTGELKGVDLDSRTFVLSIQNRPDQIFRFFDDTDVATDGGAQGLSAQRGSRARVIYSKIGAINRAVRIEITSK
jgi:hypothetical protein